MDPVDDQEAFTELASSRVVAEPIVRNGSIEVSSIVVVWVGSYFHGAMVSLGGPGGWRVVR